MLSSPIIVNRLFVTNRLYIQYSLPELSLDRVYVQDNKLAWKAYHLQPHKLDFTLSEKGYKQK